MARSSWRQARNIRRLTNLSVVEMAAMDPVWAAYEDGDVDLTPASLRTLLAHQERLGPGLITIKGVVPLGRPRPPPRRPRTRVGTTRPPPSATSPRPQIRSPPSTSADQHGPRTARRYRPSPR